MTPHRPNAPASAAPDATGGLREEDLLDFTWIADPRISPDGARVVFTRVVVDRDKDAYVTALWIVETAGGTPRPLTCGRRDSQPRWSPDGRTLAFVRAGDGAAPPQIWLLPMDGGEAAPLTALARGASSPAWSPDGTRLAFLSETNPALDAPDAKEPPNAPARVVTRPVFRENGKGFVDTDHLEHVWVVEARPGATPRPLTRGGFAEGAPQWSRDGAKVLFVSDRRAEPWFGDERAVLYAAPADLAEPTDGAALERVLEHGGPIAAWAEGPDGALAAVGYVSDDTPHSYRQASLLVGRGPWPVRRVEALNPDGAWAVGEGVNSDQHAPRAAADVPLAWSPDGGAAFTLAARRGAARLVRFDLAARTATALTPDGRDVQAASATPDARRWAYVEGGPDTPGDLWLLDAATGERTRLWAPNEAVLARGLGRVEAFEVASFDGERIPAWLVFPPAFDPARRWPLVLQIHGGPHTAYGAGFFHEFQQLAAAGYLVLYANPRGSTSYGERFADMIQYRYPGDDARDLMACVDAVVARGYVDEARLGVTGGSGGGLLTNWLITRTHRFAAAITQRCVSDWAVMWSTSDFAMYYPFWFRKAPYEDPAEYAERSPVWRVAEVRTPLMVIHSEEDWRTPIAQGEMMFRALKALRVPTVMVRFPGENHELSRSGAPSRRVQNQRHIRRWFDRWLKGVPAEEYGV
uniref:S9 family peptidase n=1 Tax=Eiseniibacteriota bacterium TaxID=2212470 RepID=A0A832ICE1_UNCEI